MIYGEIQEGQDSRQGELRLCSPRLVKKNQKTVHHEDHRHLQNGPETNLRGLDGSSTSQNHEVSLRSHLSVVLHVENVTCD